MFSTLLGHLRSQWMGALALFLVLTGGSAYALTGSNTVFSDDIVDGAVKQADVGSEAVGTDEVKNGALTANDVAPNSIGSGRIADGSLTPADLGASSVGTSEIQTNGVGPSEIKAESVSSDELVDTKTYTEAAYVNGGAVKGVNVYCPAGTQVISGGGGTTGGIPLVNTTRNGNGWFAATRNPTGEQEIVQVWAYCMEP
jgi:hypothetical protein